MRFPTSPAGNTSFRRRISPHIPQKMATTHKVLQGPSLTDATLPGLMRTVIPVGFNSRRLLGERLSEKPQAGLLFRRLVPIRWRSANGASESASCPAWKRQKRKNGGLLLPFPEEQIQWTTWFVRS